MDAHLSGFPTTCGCSRTLCSGNPLGNTLFLAFAGRQWLWAIVFSLALAFLLSRTTARVEIAVRRALSILILLGSSVVTVAIFRLMLSTSGPIGQLMAPCWDHHRQHAIHPSVCRDSEDG